jgi:primosomal protein N'
VSGRYASVYPLVAARALARPFTYAAGQEVAKGAVVSVPFRGSRRRGVVVGLEAAPPPGVQPVPIAGVLDDLAPELVDLALWVADYYGSTPARALALVAPSRPSRRGALTAPARRYSLPGEPAPASLSSSQEAALARIVAAMEEAGGHFLLHGSTGSGKT